MGEALLCKDTNNIFVVDSNDKDRIDASKGYNNNAKKQLHDLLNEEELQDIILLVYANKQDLPNAMSTDEISDRLQLNKITKIKWRIQASSALNGNGLHQGLDWIYKQLKYLK